MISVLTPTIRPQYLNITQKCLENQTYKDFEWLVEVGLVSNGFTLPRDFNKMLRRATGETIVILEDCITIPTDALEKISLLPPQPHTFPVGNDWRLHTNGEIPPDQWEIDFASAPKSLFFDVGGFDEEFCNGWSWENVEIAWRAEQTGYKFFCSQTTFGEVFDHDSVLPHPFRNTLKDNSQRAETTHTLAQTGSWKLDYL